MVGPGVDGAAPAVLGVDHVLTKLVVILRVTSTLVSVAAVAVTGLAPPVREQWVVGGVSVLGAWTALFAWHVSRHRLSWGWAAGDVLVVSALCLAHEELLPAQVLAASAGTGWVDILASSGVFMVQFGLPQPFGPLAGLAIVAAYLTGTGGFGEASVVLVLQCLLAAAIAMLLRRAARTGDLALAEQVAAQGESIAKAAVRADERDQQRRLHDTVLATLTIVNTGSVGRDSVALRLRAASDLAVLDDVRAHPRRQARLTGRFARLDFALATTAGVTRPGLPDLDVSLDVPPLELPADVVIVLAQSVGEALTNVARHSGVSAVTLRAWAVGDGVEVQVVDRGVGFDPARVPTIRRGLRESITGRMRASGGCASIVSSPGAGTTVRLCWPDV